MIQDVYADYCPGLGCHMTVMAPQFTDNSPVCSRFPRKGAVMWKVFLRHCVIMWYRADVFLVVCPNYKFTLQCKGQGKLEAVRRPYPWDRTSKQTTGLIVGLGSSYGKISCRSCEVCKSCDSQCHLISPKLSQSGSIPGTILLNRISQY